MAKNVVLVVMALGVIGLLIGLGDFKFLVPGAILLGAGTIGLAITARA